MSTFLVDAAFVVMAVFVAVGVVLLTIQLRELIAMLGAIHHAIERVAVALRKR